MKAQDTKTKLTKEEKKREQIARIDAILAESEDLSFMLRGKKANSTDEVDEPSVADTTTATKTSADKAEVKTPNKKKVTEKVNQQPEEEENTNMKNATTPKQAEKDTVKVPETPEETIDTNETDEEPNGFAEGFKTLLSILGVCALIGIFIMLILMYAGKDCTNGTKDPVGVVDTTTDTSETDIPSNDVPGINTPNTDAPSTNVPDTDAPSTNVPDTDAPSTNVPDTDAPSTNVPDTDAPSVNVPEFDMDAFVASVTNIAKKYTSNNDIGINAEVCCIKIGEDKLVKLINDFDEFAVQNGIATILAFVPEAKMQQYILKNGLDYNPNAVIEYSAGVQMLDDVYRSATGKNPDGALMSLPGYDSYNGNRDALRAMINESGDTDLLTWYNAKMEIYDVMRAQTKDTDNALAYKKTVEAELLNSNNIAKFLEIQLEKETEGTITAVDYVSMQYTEAYYNFILNYYIYIVAA